MVTTFPDLDIVHTVCAELSRSHLRLLIGVEDQLKRDFYIEICRLERWSVRQLQERIKSMLYERTAISKKPDETIRQEISILREQGQLSADLAFRDPYLLDFLGLANTHAEKRELIPFVVNRELVERSNALLSSVEGHEWNQRRVA